MEIISKEDLYDKCENMEELYDKYYMPLLKRDLILVQALNMIELYLEGAGEMACYSKSMCLYEEDIEDILEIIKKVKGDVKNEN